MSFWKPEACGQTVLPDRSVLNWTKIGGKCQNSKNSNATFFVIFKQCVAERCTRIALASVYYHHQCFLDYVSQNVAQSLAFQFTK